MKHATALLAGVCVALTAPLVAQETIDVSGDWEIAYETPRGEITMRVTFVQEGATLTGEAQGRMGGPTPISEGSVSGNQISFTIRRGRGERVFETKFTGTVEGETASGTLSSPMGGEIPWTARKVGASGAAAPLGAGPSAGADAVLPLDSALFEALRWRAIGPANMSGRITDIEGIPSPSKTFFIAAATGGIWKTTNNGTTFRPVFDNQRVVSMGDIAIAPSDTNIIWAGTGEEDSRNSISPGGGVYKSTDGGMTWQLMGLEGTQVIGRIVIHPRNPDVVYVAALGHIWNANPERGLYKTTDGGATWERIKFVSDRAGFVDIAMHPRNPNVLFASSWERVRGPYFLRSGGPGSALWKTTNGGRSWTEVTGGGFPETMKGRIGMAIAPSDPDIVYAVVEADTGTTSAGPVTTRPSGLYRSEDGGKTWTHMNSNNVRPFYYSQVRVDPWDADRVYWSSTPVNFSEDGGKTVRQATLGIHVDHHAMWMDPNDAERYIVGNDGGIAVSWDRGGNYDFINTMPLGQFYAVSYGWQVPYRVCGGLQDNGTWCGPSRRRQGTIRNEMWTSINGGDGFYTAQHPVEGNIVWAESQRGSMARIDLATGERTVLERPDWRDRYRELEDSIVVLRGDTAEPVTPEVERRIEELRAQQRADSAEQALRWNWSTPFFISTHDPNTFYAAANRVLKSTNRGDDLQPISPDLTTRDTMRIRISTTATGGITPDITGAETHSTIVALAESPLRQGLLFAGTDDGNVWLSPDDGATWEELTGRFPGVPAKTWVSRIEPSHHDVSTFYVAFDNHRENDFTPYLYVTRDLGTTFASIAGNLPTGAPDFIHVVREDPVNPNLLFVGTDVGVYLSRDGGRHWRRFMNGLPTVPVHDLQIHPRDRELIAGTHGRSIWIVDIAPLQQMTDEVLVADAHLFGPKTAHQFGEPSIGGGSTGHKVFQAPSPQYGADIVYFLTDGEAGNGSQVDIVITDAEGDTVRTLQGPARPGVHRVTWNFRGEAPSGDELSPSERRDSVRQAQRLDVVIDSLAGTGIDRQVLERLKANIQNRNFGALRSAFGFGGGGPRRGARAEFVERPGESPPPRGDRGPAAGLGGLDFRQLFRLINPQGASGGFGFGGRGGQAPLAEPGRYLVSLKLGERVLTQPLMVERAGDYQPVTAGGGQ